LRGYVDFREFQWGAEGGEFIGGVSDEFAAGCDGIERAGHGFIPRFCDEEVIAQAFFDHEGKCGIALGVGGGFKFGVIGGEGVHVHVVAGGGDSEVNSF